MSDKDYTQRMSTRLQVVLDAAELAAFRDAAQRAGLTLSQWVRTSLRQAQRATSPHDVESRRHAILAAAEHQFPAPEIDTMLAEIDSGATE